MATSLTYIETTGMLIGELLIFEAKKPKRGNLSIEIWKIITKFEISMLYLVYIPNFRSIGLFLIFGPKIPKRGNLSIKFEK